MALVDQIRNLVDMVEGEMEECKATIIDVLEGFTERTGVTIEEIFLGKNEKGRYVLRLKTESIFGNGDKPEKIPKIEEETPGDHEE